MSDRIPKNEYEVSYLHLIFFILILILLLLISFFLGYKTGEKGKCKKIIQQSEKIKKEKTPSLNKQQKKIRSEKALIQAPSEKKTAAEKKAVEQKKEEPQKQAISKRAEKKEEKKRVYKKGYYVQVAAAKDLQSAKKEAKKYRKYFKITIFAPAETDKRKFYRLRTGPFRTRAQAKNFLKKIKDRYKIKGFIVQVD